jgi:hypothetical protein
MTDTSRAPIFLNSTPISALVIFSRSSGADASLTSQFASDYGKPTGLFRLLGASRETYEVQNHPTRSGSRYEDERMNAPGAQGEFFQLGYVTGDIGREGALD